MVQDLPKDAKSVADIPADFEPSLIGMRSKLIEQIREILPLADFADPSWGRIESGDWSIEVNLGGDEECRGFALHVRGGNEAAGAVAAILGHLNLRALDSRTGEFFVAGAEAVESFERWRAFRNKAIAKHAG